MLTITVRYKDFKDLGDQIAHPVRWMTDPNYRKEILAQNQIRDLIAGEGLKVIFDTNDPKSPKRGHYFLPKIVSIGHCSIRLD